MTRYTRADGCVWFGCRNDPEKLVHIGPGDERPMCDGHADDAVSQREAAEVVGQVGRASEEQGDNQRSETDTMTTSHNDAVDSQTTLDTTTNDAADSRGGGA